MLILFIWLLTTGRVGNYLNINHTALLEVFFFFSSGQFPYLALDKINRSLSKYIIRRKDIYLVTANETWITLTVYFEITVSKLLK